MHLLNGFLQQYAEHPYRLACSENGEQFSYSMFNRQCEQIAALLQQHALESNRIALYLERGYLAATAIYAILSVNSTYIPLDTKNPSNRIKFILADAQPTFVLGLGACPAWLEFPEQWLDLSQLSDADLYTPCKIDPSAIAAILYTSGSTGSPKGVALSHQAMLNFADWAAETFALTSNDRIASLAPFHFDLSVFDLFSTLSRGASVHFLPQALTLAPARLVQWLKEQSITCWYTVPSLLGFLALKGGLADTQLPALKNILFAGEVFPTVYLLKLVQQLPEVNFYNLYGPTETNVCCYWPVIASELLENQAIPIGIPACNSTLKIHATTGELLVNSPNNFCGYWQNGTLHPAASDNWYATGDKVSLNERGQYCFHGRLDRMLKCSGYRVEPAEIEQLICQAPMVIACAVVGIHDPTSGQRPAAVVVLVPAHSLAELLPVLKTRLPQYMQPAKYLVLPELPRLSNGKIDYSTIQSLFETP